MSAAPRPPVLEQLDLPGAESEAMERALAVVPQVPDALIEGLVLGTRVAPGLRPIDVVMCCAGADLPAMGRIFDALSRHGCVPVAMTGVERDPSRLTESAQAAGQPRLYVVCKTRSMDDGQAQRLVQAFARAGRRARHQLLVLEIDVQRVYAAVPHVRRGADQLRRRIEGPAVSEVARTLELPRASTPRALSGTGSQRDAGVDTSYAMHCRADGSGEQHIDRIVVDIDPLPSGPARTARVSQRLVIPRRPGSGR